MRLIETDDGYIPIDRIVRIFDRNDGTMLVQWFNGFAVEESIAKIKRKTSPNHRVTLSAPGVELKLVSVSRAGKN
jgi:hypothetical protein